MLSIARRRLSSTSISRRFSTAVPHRIKDEGDWFYSSEWWDNVSNGQTVFRSHSNHGNGVVTVVAHPSSRPIGPSEVPQIKNAGPRPQDKVHWRKTETWLHQRYAQMHPGYEQNGYFKVIGYQWRSLRFNDDTRQSTVKVMAAYRESDPGSVCLMQQGHCLAVPYVKSMISTGLATISSCNFDLKGAIFGRKSMNVLCIGHGGGSIPLFLATKIQGALIHIVEIDPVVISASIEAMGFPSYSVMSASGEQARIKTTPMQDVLWKGTHERLFLYESDAEKFLLETNNLYDIVFIDAYNGEDIFPHKLWDPNGMFLNALRNQLHPHHGTVVVNLHSDVDLTIDGINSSGFHTLPMGKYISGVCRAYKKMLLWTGNNGLAYTVSVPWVCNTSLVVSRGLGKPYEVFGKEDVLNSLVSKSLELENVLDLPFSCLEYMRRGFVFVD